MQVMRLKFSLAKLFLREHHRHNKTLQGHKATYVLLGEEDGLSHEICDCVFDDELSEHILNGESEEFGYCDGVLYCHRPILGTMSIGRPVARFKNKNIHEITRICFNEKWKKSWHEKSYPSEFVKKAISNYKLEYPEVEKMITYIRQNESGGYLRHAGFRIDKSWSYNPNSKGWLSRGGNRTVSDMSAKHRFTKDMIDHEIDYLPII